MGKNSSVRQAFFATAKQPSYVEKEIKIGDYTCKFKVRELTFNESDAFSVINADESKTSTDKLFWLIEKGVITDTDGTPLFEPADKDMIANSTINRSISEIFMSFVDTMNQVLAVKNEEKAE